MSLIYDYLKISGKSGSERDSDVEIPPALKRIDTNRPKTQPILLILGSCLIGALLVFLVFKFFTPGRDVQVAAVKGPAPQTQETRAETIPAPRESAAAPAAEQAVSKEIRVLPEPEKSATVAASAGNPIRGDSADLPGTILNKPVLPLELKSKNRKIMFPENVPVYTGPQEIAENIEVRSSGPTGQSSTAGSKLYSSSQAASAAREKSKKFYQAGLQAQYKGDGRIAEIYYNKALEEVEHHMNAMINLSALYVQQERYAEAEEILAEILEIEPANSKGLVNMGVVNLYLGKESQAAAQFEAALAANPLEENALVNLAYLAEKNRDYMSTEMYYRQLLQISPENLEVLLAYGHLLEEQGRYPEALALYADILELGTLKKDQRLYNRISDRMRLLAGVVKNSQP